MKDFARVLPGAGMSPPLGYPPGGNRRKPGQHARSRVAGRAVYSKGSGRLMLSSSEMKVSVR